MRALYLIRHARGAGFFIHGLYYCCRGRSTIGGWGRDNFFFTRKAGGRPIVGRMSEGDAMVDAELVLKFKGGEESAFEVLVRKYMKDAYSFCLKLTHDAQEAEELSQMGFVSAYRALRGFRGESSFKSWLYRIFINQYRDRLRRTKRAEARLVVVRQEAERKQSVLQMDTTTETTELEDVVKGKIELLPDR